VGAWWGDDLERGAAHSVAIAIAVPPLGTVTLLDFD
jgi:hypothetical protein